MQLYLINYDFYDLYALITFFRNNTERFIAYKLAVEQLVEYLNSPPQNGTDFNAVRTILKPHYNEADKALSWVLVSNYYTANVSIITNEASYRIISSIFEEMLRYYDDKQRFYLLCDAVHNIPLVLADLKKPKKAVRSMIMPYRKVYDKAFLLSELKQL